MRLPLKVVGEGPLRSRLERSAGSNVEFLGWVDDSVLAALYGSCQALIFPGEEDFGIVLLEAQACGRPIIAYEKGGVLETVIPVTANTESGGSPTGIFFSEQTPEALIKRWRYIRGCKAGLNRRRSVTTLRNFRQHVSEVKFTNTSRPERAVGSDQPVLKQRSEFFQSLMMLNALLLERRMVARLSDPL